MRTDFKAFDILIMCVTVLGLFCCLLFVQSYFHIIVD